MGRPVLLLCAEIRLIPLHLPLGPVDSFLRWTSAGDCVARMVCSSARLFSTWCAAPSYVTAFLSECPTSQRRESLSLNQISTYFALATPMSQSKILPLSIELVKIFKGEIYFRSGVGNQWLFNTSKVTLSGFDNLEVKFAFDRHYY